MQFAQPSDINGERLEVGDRVAHKNQEWPHFERYGAVTHVYEDCNGIDCRGGYQTAKARGARIEIRSLAVEPDVAYWTRALEERS